MSNHRTVVKAFQLRVNDVIQIPFFPHDELYRVTLKETASAIDSITVRVEPLDNTRANPLQSMTTGCDNTYILVEND